MPSCIICHEQIDDSSDSYEECPNGHKLHIICLRKWLDQSFNCPLCNSPYNENIANKFKLYQKQKEKEKVEELKSQIMQESVQKIDKISKKINFLKLIETIKLFIKNEEYEKALDELDDYEEESEIYNKETIIFFRGKINFLRKKYDIAISFLFKLIKENFNYPEAFKYLGKSYQALGLDDKAKWAFDRVL